MGLCKTLSKHQCANAECENETNATSTATMKAEITITKELVAVWQALSSPQKLPLWYGPSGAKIHVASMNFATGKTALISMTMPNGHTMWEQWTYTQITHLETIAFNAMITDENAAKPLDMGSMPSELSSVLSLSPRTLSPQGNKTNITLESKLTNPTPEHLQAFAKNLEPMKNAWLASLKRIQDIT